MYENLDRELQKLKQDTVIEFLSNHSEIKILRKEYGIIFELTKDEYLNEIKNN